MILIAKIIIAITVAAVLAVAFRMFFSRQAVMNEFELSANTPVGYNFFMGDIGGVVLSTIIFRVLTIIDPVNWALVLILAAGSVLICRIISFIRDGAGQMSIIAASEEAVTIGCAWILWSSVS